MDKTYSMNFNEQFIKNSLPDQRLSYANQLNIQQWNTIINTLKTQANNNTAYLQKLHTWLVGTGTGSADIEGHSLYEYVLSNVQSHELQFSEIFSTLDTKANKLETYTKDESDTKFVNTEGTQTIKGSKTFSQSIILDASTVNERSVSPVADNTGSVGKDNKHFKYAYINNLLSNQLLPIDVYGTTSSSSIGSIGNSKLYWNDAYINSINSSDINASSIKINNKEVATQEYVDTLLSDFKFQLQPVDSLPTKDISTTTIYLLKTNNDNDNNSYAEYIYINGEWELIGNTEFELDGKLDTTKEYDDGSKISINMPASASDSAALHIQTTGTNNGTNKYANHLNVNNHSVDLVSNSQVPYVYSRSSQFTLTSDYVQLTLTDTSLGNESYVSAGQKGMFLVYRENKKDIDFIIRGITELDQVSKDYIKSFATPKYTTDLINNSFFISSNEFPEMFTNQVQSQNIAKKTDITNAIRDLSVLKMQVVNELPTDNISTSTIYLVLNTDAEGDNVHDEYIYTDNGWELIGSTKTGVENLVTTDTYQSINAIKDFHDVVRVIDLEPLNKNRTSCIGSLEKPFNISLVKNMFSNSISPLINAASDPEYICKIGTPDSRWAEIHGKAIYSSKLEADEIFEGGTSLSSKYYSAKIIDEKLGDIEHILDIINGEVQV